MILALMFYMLASASFTTAQTVDGPTLLLRSSPAGVEQFTVGANASGGPGAGHVQSPWRTHGFSNQKKEKPRWADEGQSSPTSNRRTRSAASTRALLGQVPTTMYAGHAVVTPQTGVALRRDCGLQLWHPRALLIMAHWRAAVQLLASSFLGRCRAPDQTRRSWRVAREWSPYTCVVGTR